MRGCLVLASELKRSDFHYELPTELIASEPLAERSARRMLVLPAAPAGPEDRRDRKSVV